MPSAPAKLCSRANCGGLVREGQCSRCGPVVKTGFTHKTSRQSRGYGADWFRLRMNVIKRRLLAAGGVIRCELCNEAIINESIHADHREPFHGLDDPRRLDPSNIRLSHRRCHMQRTRDSATPDASRVQPRAFARTTPAHWH